MMRDALLHPTAALAQARAWRGLAETAMADRPITADDARRVLAASDDELPAQLWAAYAVRATHFGRRVKLCVLNNARSGLCPEDCGYCSQSAEATSDIKRYRLKSVDELVAGAHSAVERGARRYCMVTSARGPSAADIRHFGAAARAIRKQLPDVELCVSLGIMGDAEAESLRASGIDFVNHNLNTSQRFYPEICTTHTYEDRVATVRSARRAGLSACSGVIVGLGETDDDLVDVAFALAELGVESLPVNFLIPIDGTTLTTGDPPSVGRCLRSLVLFRLTNPRAEIRAAGGRERNLGGAQSLALFAANSVFVDGYLTTAGQAHRDAASMIETLGFEVETAPALMDSAVAL